MRALIRPYLSAYRHRQLVMSLSDREIRSSFSGSMLGATWILLRPLLSLTVYALVFGGILGLGREGGGMNFVSQLFAGMIVFQAFSELASRAPRLVLSRPNYVTKVAFPLDILPWPIAALSAIYALSSTAMLVLLHATLVGAPAWTAVLLPLVLLPALLFGLGACWLLSALGVYIRDTQEVVRVALQLLFFLSPIVWTLEMVQNPVVTDLVLLNPLAVLIETMRAALAGTPGAGPLALSITTAASVVFAAAAYAAFQRLKDGFADVI